MRIRLERTVSGIALTDIAFGSETRPPAGQLVSAATRVEWVLDGGESKRHLEVSIGPLRLWLQALKRGLPPDETEEEVAQRERQEERQRRSDRAIGANRRDEGWEARRRERG